MMVDALTPTVAVITLTRNRARALESAIASVEAQSHPAIEHWIVADRCEVFADERTRKNLEAVHPQVRILYNDSRTENYLPTHCAQLRARAARAATADIVALLDDDNTYEPTHLASVLDRMRDEGRAAGHSWRTLWDRGGRLWAVSDHDPWVPDPRLSRLSFARMSELGVFREGSNVVRDLARHGDQVGRVDTNEWVLAADIFLEYTTDRVASAAERRLGLTEDALLTGDLVRGGLPIACSELATVRYSMGGYSNENVSGVSLEESL